MLKLRNHVPYFWVFLCFFVFFHKTSPLLTTAKVDLLETVMNQFIKDKR